jgi:ABC-type transporter Mla subunit MlaD
MPSVLETLLLPQRLGFALVAALPRALTALESIDRTLQDVERRLARIDDVPGEIEGLQRAFGRSSDEIAALREAMTPEIAALRETLEPVVRDLDHVADDLDEVRDVVQPLLPAAERLGRLAERFPGPGRPGRAR